MKQRQVNNQKFITFNNLQRVVLQLSSEQNVNNVSACFGVRNTLYKGDSLDGSYPGQQANLHYLCSAPYYKAKLQGDCNFVLYDTRDWVR